MKVDELEALLAEERGHLPVADDSHFHIVVSTDNPDERTSPFISSPPYRNRTFADQDARDPRFIADKGALDVNILECRRACPRSSLGRFGWEDEQPEPYHWWDRWPGLGVQRRPK